MGEDMYRLSRTLIYTVGEDMYRRKRFRYTRDLGYTYIHGRRRYLVLLYKKQRHLVLLY